MLTRAVIAAAIVAAVGHCVSALPCLAPLSYTCPAEALGCHALSSGALPNECCVANNGYLVFAQNWTAGLMQKASNLAFIDTDVVANLPRDEWTIHGLWPDNCDGSYNTSSFGCDLDLHRNYSDVDVRLRNAVSSHEWNSLRKYWQGADGNYNWFYSHEWSKHGTCFSPLKPNCLPESKKNDSDIYEYFTKTLKLRSEYNLYDIFEEKGIVPSDTQTYTRDQFNSAIQDVTGFPGGIQCVTNATTGYFYVSEVWIYLFSAPDLTFVPASPTFGPKANFQSCPANGTIYYAPNPYHHHHERIHQSRKNRDE